jgi:hypothetical protein
MSNDAQRLKAAGHLPALELPDVERASIDTSQYTAVLENRFCGCPDFPDAEIADAELGALERYLGLDEDECRRLKKLHTRWLSTTGRGSWPAGCHAAYSDRHAVTFYCAYGTFPSHYRRQVRDSELDQLAGAKVWGTLTEIKAQYAGESMLSVALSLCEETYRRRGVKLIEVTEPRGDQIHILSKFIAGSTIGYAYFNDATCGDHVTCNIDSSYKPGLHSCTTLIAHELGHNNNLPHTFSGQSRHHGIMSYAPMYPYVGYSTGKDLYDRPRDPSISQLIRQYGDEPIPDDEQPPPPQGDWPKITEHIYGEVLDDGGVAIRGSPVLRNVNGRDWPYLIEPVQDDPGKFRFTPRYL